MNAFLDRNDLPLNGLATIQGYKGQCTPSCWIAVSLFTRPIYFPVRCNRSEEKGWIECTHTSYLSPRSPIYRWRKNWSCGEISDFNTQQMWRNQKFCQIWRNFKILHMTDVKKSEIYPVFGCEICFVAIYAIFCLNCFVAIYALLCGKKLKWKLYRWRKNDKYEVWTWVVPNTAFFLQDIYLLAFWYCCLAHSHLFHLAYLPAVCSGQPSVWEKDLLRQVQVLTEIVIFYFPKFASNADSRMQ